MSAIGISAVLIELRSNARQEIEIVEAERACASLKQIIRHSENAKKDLRFLANSGTLSTVELKNLHIQLSQQ